MKINNLAGKNAIREMEIYWYKEYAVPSDLPAFVVAEILPRIGMPGRLSEKRRDKRKFQCLLHLVHNLLRAGMDDRVVVDPRDEHKTPPMRIQMWDKLVSVGLAHLAPGSQWSEKASRYIPSSKLLNLHKMWPQSLLRNVGADGPLVVLTSGEVEPVTGTDLPDQPANYLRNIKEAAIDMAWADMKKAAPEQVLQWWQANRPQNGVAFGRMVKEATGIIDRIRDMEGKLHVVNAANAKHKFIVDINRPSSLGDAPTRTASQVCPTLRQIHSRGLFRASRLYTVGSPGQNMPRVQRATMQIDGQPTVEPDFKCQHLWMLYHIEGLYPAANDLYRPERIFPKFYASDPPKQQRMIVRDFVKRATLAALNSANRAEAVGSIKQKMDEDKELTGIVMDVEGLKCNTVLEALAAAHAGIQMHLFKSAGLWLMSVDGVLMLDILHVLALRDIPSFPIHDSIRCRRADVDTVRQVMEQEYEQVFNATPRISD